MNRGKIEVGNLPVGDYYLREVVAPPSHILNTEEIHFTISDTQAVKWKSISLISTTIKVTRNFKKLMKQRRISEARNLMCT